MSSLFNQASLVVEPAVYENAKVYATKPFDGSGDLTFSRASGATRVDSNGLIDKVRTNLLLQSNTFDTTWTATNATLTSGQSGYDGSNDAWKIEAATTSTTRIYQSSSIAANTLITISLYAKVGNVDFIKFNLATSGTNSIVTFDLTDGTTSSSTAIDTAWESVGSGWVRIAATFLNVDAITESRIEVRSNANSATCDAGSFVYIQDAQLNYGLAAQDYVETTTTAVSAGPVSGLPRLDYLNSSCPKLLLEPQRTNLFPYSEYVNGLILTQATATENAETSPEGLINAARLYDNAIDAQHRVYGNISVTSGTTYTFSVFAKKGTLRYCYLLSTANGTERWFFDLQEGTAITSGGKIEDYGNGWYRLSVQVVPSSTGNAVFSFSLSNDNQDNIYIGTGTDYHIVYGFQLEAGGYHTSYIPTNGTSVTRVGEQASKTGLQAAGVFGATAGSVMLDLQGFSQDSNQIVWQIQDASASPILRLYYKQEAACSVFQIYNSINLEFVTANFTLTTNPKIAIVWDGTSRLEVFGNGAKITRTGGLFSSNAVADGITKVSTNTDVLNIKQLLIFPTALTDAQAIELTTI